jgi:zinc transporter ZupT
MSSPHTAVARILFRLLAEGEEAAEHHEDEQHDDNINNDKPWWSIIGAALIVQAATLTGLIIVVGLAIHRKRTGNPHYQLRHNRLLLSLIPSFAAGALIATVVFLIVPESIALIGGESHGAEAEEEAGHEEDHAAERFLLTTAFRMLVQNETSTEDEHHEEEGEDHATEEAHEEEASTWKFGVFFFVGFMIPLLIGAFFPSTADMKIEESQVVQEEQAPVAALTEIKSLAKRQMTEEIQVDDDEPGLINRNEADKVANSMDGHSTAHDDDDNNNNNVIRIKDLPMVNPQLAVSILFGDFMHNFADGIFIGTAFLLCDSTLAWTLAASTVYHELAQEIADFMLLTEFCDFSITKALAANFISGFSVVIGALIVASVQFSNVVVGCILAVSSGVYMYIAIAECIPKMFGQKSRQQRLLCLLFFVLGAIPIGLVLLSHEHCEAGH